MVQGLQFYPMHCDLFSDPSCVVGDLITLFAVVFIVNLLIGLTTLVFFTNIIVLVFFY